MMESIYFDIPAKFSTLEFNTHSVFNSGVQATVIYPNGYEASVIRLTSYLGAGSYGHEDGLYELAVAKDHSLTYDTPITDDVIGHLSKRAVTKLLKDIFEYDKKQTKKKKTKKKKGD